MFSPTRWSAADFCVPPVPVRALLDEEFHHLSMPMEGSIVKPGAGKIETARNGVDLGAFF